MHRFSFFLSLFTLPLYANTTAPEGFTVYNQFSNHSDTPCPACLCAAPDGTVFVGVDMHGSLGKGPGKGKIVRIRDKDNDGKADEFIDYAFADHPRGLFAVGDQLYVLHATYADEADNKLIDMRLSVYTDADNDGKADAAPKSLVTNLSSPKFLRERGADHCTNGIRMGIDGWIYIAVGDFGFHNATGSDGTTLTLMGGGIVRVRPDGSEMELYTKGTRNTYDLAIDPFMNIFARGNTNDGGGWNVRFIHHLQSAQYGYPTLFKNFTDEILPALADLGGGSGVGALFIDEPSWPEKYNKLPLMADWGRSALLIHRVTPDGASFSQNLEPFIKCAQITDIDVDASGRLYLSAWNGAGYRGNPNIGYVSMVTPPDWKPSPSPDFESASVNELLELLKSESSTIRFHASRQLIKSEDSSTVAMLEKLANDQKNSAESRSAAVSTLAQQTSDSAIPALLNLAKIPQIQALVLRALTDRLETAKSLPLDPFLKALNDPDPRTSAQAVISLGRIARANPNLKTQIANALLPLASPPTNGKTTTSYRETQTLRPGESCDFDFDLGAFKDIFIIAPSDKKETTYILESLRHERNDGVTDDLINLPAETKRLNFAGAKIDLDAKTITAKTSQRIAIPVIAKRTVGRLKGRLHIPAGQGTEQAVKLYFSPTPKLGKPEGPHATPNPEIIIPHLAAQALIAMKADHEAASVLRSHPDAALWILRNIHSEKSVSRLIDYLVKGSNLVYFPENTKQYDRLKVLSALFRLYHKETPYKGDTWWTTRPDTRGPYYYPMKWELSDKIETFLKAAFKAADAPTKEAIIALAEKHRVSIDGIYTEAVDPALAKKGEVGRTSIEDVVLYLEKHKGKAAKGNKVLQGLSCVACHNITPDQAIKGPDLATLGKISSADLAEAIIQPANTIAKSWVTLTLKDGSSHMGTIVKESKSEVILHNIAGQPSTLDAKQIAKRAPGPPLMGEHLVDDLSLQQLADMIAYIQAMDKNAKAP